MKMEKNTGVYEYIRKNQILDELPREKLLEIHDNLNKWQWDESIGEVPKNWESMTIEDKHAVVRDWMDLIKCRVSYKEILRYHHLHNLGSTESEYEDWWDSMVLDRIGERLDELERKIINDKCKFYQGIYLGLSLSAILIAIFSCFI